jgi:hypothetical protein
MELSTVFGVPAHPLIVHIPVIGIPLMVLAVLAYIVIPAKPRWLFWTAGSITAVVTLGTVLATGSGEQLESMLPADDRQSSLIQRHVELGDQTRAIVLVFAALAMLYLALDYWKGRQQADRQVVTTATTTSGNRLTSVHKVMLVVGVAAIVAGGLATTWDVRTGHAGAKSAWEDVATESPQSAGE